MNRKLAFSLFVWSRSTSSFVSMEWEDYEVYEHLTASSLAAQCFVRTNWGQLSLSVELYDSDWSRHSIEGSSRSRVVLLPHVNSLQSCWVLASRRALFEKMFDLAQMKKLNFEFAVASSSTLLERSFCRGLQRGAAWPASVCLVQWGVVVLPIGWVEAG